MSSMPHAGTDTFAWVDWIVAEREREGWTQADLARKAKVTRQTINDYESRRRVNPDEKILSRISIAFGYPDDHLPRIAGLLPQRPDEDEGQKQLDHLYHTLKEQSSKNSAVDFLRHLVELEEKKHGRRKKP